MRCQQSAREITEELKRRGQSCTVPLSRCLSRLTHKLPEGHSCKPDAAEPGSVKPSSCGCTHSEGSLQRRRWHEEESLPPFPKAAAIPGGSPICTAQLWCSSARAVFHTLQGIMKHPYVLLPARQPSGKRLPWCSREEGTWATGEVGALTFIFFCTQIHPWEHQRPRSGLEIGPVLIARTSSGSQVTPHSVGA